MGESPNQDEQDEFASNFYEMTSSDIYRIDDKWAIEILDPLVIDNPDFSLSKYRLVDQAFEACFSERKLEFVYSLLDTLNSGKWSERNRRRIIYSTTGFLSNLSERVSGSDLYMEMIFGMSRKLIDLDIIPFDAVAYLGDLEKKWSTFDESERIEVFDKEKGRILTVTERYQVHLKQNLALIGQYSQAMEKLQNTFVEIPRS